MKKKTKLAILGVIALILVTIGITYAYWLVTRTQTKENVISSGCLDITLDNEQNDIVLTDQVPISDKEGMSLVPYTFTVTNNCNTSVDYQIALEAIGEESKAISTSALKVALDDLESRILSNNISTSITVEDAYEAYVIGTGTLAAKDTDGSSITHNVRIWIAADASISEMNKIFTGKISVTIGQGIESTLPEIADVVNYDDGVESYTGNWQVLGIEDGQVLLLSDAIGKATLTGKDGYENGTTYLDNMTLEYGNGNGADSSKTRSVRIDDLDRITGYNPKSYPSNNEVYMQGFAEEYGNVGTFRVEGENVIFNGSNGIVSTESGSTATFFKKIDDGEKLAEGTTYTITNDFYSYKITDRITSVKKESNSTYVGYIIPVTTEVNDMLIDEEIYWLATPYKKATKFAASWGMCYFRATYGNDAYGDIWSDWLVNSRFENEQSKEYNVRAVVYLNKNVKFEKQADGSFNIM